MTLYKIKGLTKKYGKNTAEVVALNKIDLEIPEGKFIVILGESGSGKTTLLNIIGCMDRPTEGKIFFQNENISEYSRKQMTDFRRKTIGFVFQSYNLLPDLTALENIELSTEMSGFSRIDAFNALKDIGLEDRARHFPSELSGGEQQRVSIARAIAKHPKVLLCDEPTGALDFKTGIMVLEVLKKIHKEQGTTVIFITHNREIAKIADMAIRLRSGNVIDIQTNENPLMPGEVEW
jgi:putative ABC transport system ATP-binding protein